MMIDELLPDKFKDDDKLYCIKQGLQELRKVEKTILEVYLDTGTYTATAKEFNVSIPTARNYVLNIIQRLKDMCDDTTTTTD